MTQSSGGCCPIERTASLIGDRWTPLIVRDLAPGCRRFGELQRSLDGISPKTLSDRLRRLEEAEVVVDALAPIQTRIAELTADPEIARSVLAAGAEQARVRAAAKMEIVRDRIGLGLAARETTGQTTS